MTLILILHQAYAQQICELKILQLKYAAVVACTFNLSTHLDSKTKQKNQTNKNNNKKNLNEQTVHSINLTMNDQAFMTYCK